MEASTHSIKLAPEHLLIDRSILPLTEAFCSLRGSSSRLFTARDSLLYLLTAVAKEMSEDRKKGEETPIGETVASVFSSARQFVVKSLAHVNYGVDYLKETVVPVAAFDEGKDRVLSPVQDAKINVEQVILGTSSSINEHYPFLSSMAKAHQNTLTVQMGATSGLITTMALRNIVMRRIRLFLGVSTIVGLNTYMACELIKFVDHHKR